MQLKSDRLTVDITEPSSPAAYHGSRYNWNAFISQVTLDKKDYFCLPGGDKGSGGQGLCNEFGIFEPVGYDDAEVGDQFPKLGVGLLTKEETEPYGFYKEYEIAPFPVRISSTDTSAEFEIDPIECRGYAVAHKETVSVDGSILVLSYELKNVGSKPVHTHQYVHNFFAFNSFPLDENYQLTVPFACKEPKKHIDVLTIDGCNIHWTKPSEKVFYTQFKDNICGDSYSLSIFHKSSGLGVRETGNHRLLWLALYAQPNTICPEAFIEIDLPPGATKTWSRRYEFFRK